MRIFRHKNGFLYTIEQVGRGRTITPSKNWNHFYANPYETNKNAPKLGSLGIEPDLKDFTLEYEI